MKEEMLKLLTELVPSVDFTKDKLIDDGLLDSVTLIEVISELEEQYGVEIPFEEIMPENFNNIDAIVALVEKYK